MNNQTFDLNFSYAFGEPDWQSRFREFPEDFQVTEQFDTAVFSGEGEHQCFYIEKRNENTRWVVKALFEALDIPEKSIGYCGLKDRRAVTRQWFSVHLPGKESVNIEQLQARLGDTMRILDTAQHHKKLRRGDHNGNRFAIVLRELQSVMDAEDKKGVWIEAQITDRLTKIIETGVPNYFGEQRFGKEGGNLQQADSMLSAINKSHQEGSPGQRRRKQKKGRGNLQGIYLSAARSYLFNQVLSQRLSTEGLAALTGDETGPLWGRGRSPVGEDQRALELQLLSAQTDWLNALEFSGLSQDRRALIMKPEGLSFSFEGNNLHLDFSLQNGQYATSLLRELSLFTPVETGL